MNIYIYMYYVYIYMVCVSMMGYNFVVKHILLGYTQSSTSLSSKAWLLCPVLRLWDLMGSNEIEWYCTPLVI